MPQRQIVRPCHVSAHPGGSLRGASHHKSAKRRGLKEKSTARPLAERGSLVDLHSRVLTKRKQPHSQKNGQALRPISSRGPERSWLRDHQAEYPGAWVALDGENLIAHGSSAKDVIDQA